MTANYQFDPTKFGFLPPEQMPNALKYELAAKSYIKVIEADANSFWYVSCNQYVNTDERWCFHSGVKSKYSKLYSSSVIYSGCITSDAYAKSLLTHLLGTTTNEGTLKYGKERLTAPSLKVD